MGHRGRSQLDSRRDSIPVEAGRPARLGNWTRSFFKYSRVSPAAHLANVRRGDLRPPTCLHLAYLRMERQGINTGLRSSIETLRKMS